jgi:hypothetical protein
MSELNLKSVQDELCCRVTVRAIEGNIAVEIILILLL